MKKRIECIFRLRLDMVNPPCPLLSRGWGGSVCPGFATLLWLFPCMRKSLAKIESGRNQVLNKFILEALLAVGRNMVNGFGRWIIFRYV